MKEEEIVDNKTNKREKMTGSVKRTLDIMLKLEANSASCIAFYEPREPKQIANFKRKN